MIKDDLLTVSEAAEKIDRSVGWIRGAIKKRQLGHIRFGGRVLIPKSSLDKLFHYIPPRVEDK
jgi:excisionase family DNA binding protein